MAAYVQAEQPDLRRHSAPDGTVAMLFSDIENSTALDDEMGDVRWMDVLHMHNDLLRQQIEATHGYEVKSMGDGFMVAFKTASDAVRCAVGFQRTLAETQELKGIRVRIGVHAGEMIKEGGDFYGKHVNLAARIGSASTGGQILVSQLLHDIVEPRREFTFRASIELVLKGLQGTHRVFEVEWA